MNATMRIDETKLLDSRNSLALVWQDLGTATAISRCCVTRWQTLLPSYPLDERKRIGKRLRLLQVWFRSVVVDGCRAILSEHAGAQVLHDLDGNF